MLNKIFWFFILIIVIYLLLVFKAPTLSWVIEKSIWVKGLSQIILNFKNTYDDTVTKIPTEREIQDTYNVIYSGATDYKEKFVNWAAITKWKVDTIREKISWAKGTYNDLKGSYDDAKKWYNDAKDFIDKNSERLNTIKKAIDAVSNNTIPVNSWSTNNNTWITNTWYTYTWSINTWVTN